MSDAMRSQGVLIEIDQSGSSPFSYVEIKEVTDIGPIGGGQTPDIDVTHLRSSAREYLSGLRDENTATINGNLILSDAGQSELRQAAEDGIARHFRVTFTDSGTPDRAEFFARVKGFGTSVAVDAKIPFTAELRITGAVSWMSL